MNKLWYAVVIDNDGDWGNGSFDYDEAVRIAQACVEGDTFARVDIVAIDGGYDEDGNATRDPLAIRIEKVK